MNFDWVSWETHVAAADVYLEGCNQILTAENYTEVFKRLPTEYQCINVVGNSDDSALNNASLLGLIRVLPVARDCDFYVTSYLWPERKHAGLFVNLCLFKNGYRLTMSFADETVYFKMSKRCGMHYKCFMTGNAVIMDQADMQQIEKLLQMMED